MITIKIVNIVSIILNSIVFFVAAYNLFEYLFKLGSKKGLIILFYLTVFAMTISVIVMSAFEIGHGMNGIYDIEFLNLNVVKAIAIAIMYWTVGLSMFKLGVSIQLIFEEINNK